MKKRRNYAVKITTSGDIAPVYINRSYSLAELQNHVGGHFEFVSPRYIKEKLTMVLNEEGKLKGLKPNLTATEIYGTGDTIVGDVLIVKRGNDDIAFFTINEADEKCDFFRDYIEY